MIFLIIPFESLIYQNQKAYYDALQSSTDRTNSTSFIEFILQMILDTIVRHLVLMIKLPLKLIKYLIQLDKV